MECGIGIELLRDASGQTQGSRRVTKVVKRPVCAQQGAGPVEHRAGGVVIQLPERPSQRPPQRVVASFGHEAAELGLVEPQPHERVR